MTDLNLLIREAVNAVVCALFLCLTLRFWLVRRSTNRIVEPVRHQFASALCLLCAGEVVRSALAWFSLSAQTSKWPRAWIQNASPGWIVGGALILVGAMWCLKVFQPRGRDHGVAAAVVLAAVFLAVALWT